MAELTPAALRAVAADLDQRVDTMRKQCRCLIHQVRANALRDLAADYRTQALRIEIAARRNDAPP